MMTSTSATVSGDGDDDEGNVGEQVPETDGTLFAHEVGTELILDEDDDVGDLHAITEDDHQEDNELGIQRFRFQVLILGISWMKAREKVQEHALRDLFTGGFLTQEVM